ncbi:MAG: YraN family protein [Rubritalea sp.]|uniref:YraN family protein n=1 Tax=Rubritalea sp. TaxID=2109375 RepID=UPI003242E6EF
MLSFLYRCLPSKLLDRPFSFKVRGVKMSHIEVGEIGERMSVAHLRRSGKKILYRNYRGPKGGELDIVARDRDSLCFVEVKTRRKREGSRPLDAVTPEKQELIERGARSWLGLLPHNEFQWRFDIVEVILEEGELPVIHVVEEAF